MQDTTVYHNPDFKYYSVDSAMNETLWFDGDTGGLVARHFKAGPIMGTKVNGKWVKPLPYTSHHISVNGRPFDQFWAGSFSGSPFSHEKGVAVTGDIAVNPHEGVSSTSYNVIMPNWIVSQTEAAALSKMKSDALNLALSVMETVRDAPSMVKSLTKAAKLINDLRRGRYGDFFTGLRPHATPPGAASAWLQFKFGIQPIMNDIVAGVDKIREGLPEAVGRVVVARKDPTYRPLWTDKPSWFDPSQLYELQGSTWKRSCKIGLSFAVPNPYIALADSLGLTNPAALLWQTMRLSFVIDWFIPIGAFLESLTTPLVYEFRGGYRDEYIKSSADLRYTRYHAPHFVLIRPPGDPYHYLKIDQTSLSRIVYTTFPIPWPYPHFNLGTGQVSTAIALMLSASR